MSIEDFQTIKQIGKGAFGMVYLVRRNQDKSIYALKRVQIAKMKEKEKHNALNEIRILASLAHPNIISYKECFFDDESESLNLVMEFADDGDLQTKIQSHIKSNLSFKEDAIWSIFIQMIQGLKALHDVKILHRDLKSANIFLMKNGLCKLGDMNVSKVAKMGLLYTQTGTPYYASPEVWSDKPYNHKSDIWSIGCILYELCCLNLPFKGKNFDDVYKNVLNGRYHPIPGFYSRDLSDLIHLLLQVNPYNRPTCDMILVHPFIVKRLDKCPFVYDNDCNDPDSHNELIESIRFNSLHDLKNVLPKGKKYKADNTRPYVKAKTIDKSDSTTMVKMLRNQATLIRSNSLVHQPRVIEIKNNCISNRNINSNKIIITDEKPSIIKQDRSKTPSNNVIRRSRPVIETNNNQMIDRKTSHDTPNEPNDIIDYTTPNKNQSQSQQSSSVQSTNPNTRESLIKSIPTSNRKIQKDEIRKALKYIGPPRPVATRENINKCNLLQQEKSNQNSNNKRERPQSCDITNTKRETSVDPSKKVMINPIKIVDSHHLKNLLPSHMQIKLNSMYMFKKNSIGSEDEDNRIHGSNLNCIPNHT